MSNCRKCRALLPEGANYCHVCGTKQGVNQRPKSRANGTGTVYKTGDTWTAKIVTGYHRSASGKLSALTKRKGGFKTKKEAYNYLPQLLGAPRESLRKTKFKTVFDLWLPTHRAGDSTIGNYTAAFRYFSPVYDLNISDINIDDLQECVDDCPRGKRTKENMKACASLMYKFAIPRRMTADNLNMANFIVVTGESSSKDGLPSSALEKIRRAAGTVPGADVVLCQCYLGFRPGELIALTVADYDPEHRAFVGGSKTDAGRDRTVTVSPKIQCYIDAITTGKSSDSRVFTRAAGEPFTLDTYRADFYKVLEACGIDNPEVIRDGIRYKTYTPHSCRHTFATLMKRVQGSDKDKLELIGHTSTEMLRHYQDVSFDDLRAITDKI